METLSIRRFPGLKQLWSSLHTATPQQSATVGDYLNRLARALLDVAYQDDDPWIAQGRTLFAQAGDGLDSNQTSWEIGVQLAHALKEKRLAFNPRSDVLTAPYRDDNRYFWEFEEFDFEKVDRRRLRHPAPGAQAREPDGIHQRSGRRRPPATMPRKSGC